MMKRGWTSPNNSSGGVTWQNGLGLRTIVVAVRKLVVSLDLNLNNKNKNHQWWWWWCHRGGDESCGQRYHGATTKKVNPAWKLLKVSSVISSRNRDGAAKQESG
jgi:hypothetical protein